MSQFNIKSFVSFLRNRNGTCPKCRQIFSPHQLVKLYLSSIVNLDSSDDDDSAEIDNVLKESETCLVKINQMMRQMEGMNREVGWICHKTA